jgi:hypothetical protein
MKKIPHILCAILACAPLTFEARAAAETGRGSKGRDAAVAASPRRGSVTSQGGVAQAGRGNADRLHSLLNAQARGRLARQPVRAGSTRGVIRGRSDVRGSQGVSPAGNPKLAAPNSAAPSPVRLPTPRNPAAGGPHAQGPGRVGGPAISRATHSATVDGAQLRRKF